MTGFSSIILVVVVLAGIGGSLFISARLTRRAANRVVEIFEKCNAIGIHQAKTINELGLTPPNFIDRFTRMRDYTQNALGVLMKANIISTTEEGKLFIPEDKLIEWKNREQGNSKAGR